jgi:hypothetical protein
MSGSLKWFEYSTTDNRKYAIFMDESNGEAVSNTDLVSGGTEDLDALPRNVRPRFASYRSLDGKVQRKIHVTSNTANITTLPTSISIAAIDGNPATTVMLAAFTGEKQTRIPKASDSGQDDGDPT